MATRNKKDSDGVKRLGGSDGHSPSKSLLRSQRNAERNGFVSEDNKGSYRRSRPSTAQQREIETTSQLSDALGDIAERAIVNAGEVWPEIVRLVDLNEEIEHKKKLNGGSLLPKEEAWYKILSLAILNTFTNTEYFKNLAREAMSYHNKEREGIQINDGAFLGAIFQKIGNLFALEKEQRRDSSIRLIDGEDIVTLYADCSFLSPGKGGIVSPKAFGLSSIKNVTPPDGFLVKKGARWVCIKTLEISSAVEKSWVNGALNSVFLHERFPHVFVNLISTAVAVEDQEFAEVLTDEWVARMKKMRLPFNRSTWTKFSSFVLTNPSFIGRPLSEIVCSKREQESW